MIALFVQTLLLLGAAYFVGAALACLIRRSLHVAARPALTAERRVDPLPEVAQRAAGADRFRGRPGQEPRPAPIPPPAPAIVPAAAAAAPAQDLKRIRQIDAGLEAGLNKLGVRRYEQIAAWMQTDVRRISDALGLGGRISQENWIEQAQVLAKGGETHFATRRARGEAATAAPTPDEGERRPTAPVGGRAPTAVSPRPSTGGAAGVVAEVAIATAGFVARTMAVTAPTFDSPPNVAERAAFAVEHELAPALASATAPTAPGPTTPAPTAPALLPKTQPYAAASSEPAVPIRPSAPPARDNLQRISGIDGEIEKLLVAQGVARYLQIAHWSPADVERFEALVGTAGRIGRENWIEQAQILSRGGDTKFSRNYDRGGQAEPAPSPRPVRLADAIQEHAAKAGSEASVTIRPARSDLSSLRSVRSEAYQNAEQGAEAAQRTATQNRVLRSAPRDDLKRIRGIGVLIENRLNAMGIVSYEQIANWTAQDIDRVSQSLDFKGRIERENWVEQARILASGGATEFSRRVDRGEMDTGRYKR
jgi:predicted flap endonuclease-1-like 5' DNA nuclease